MVAPVLSLAFLQKNNRNSTVALPGFSMCQAAGSDERKIGEFW
jgi:hypothetical protein